MPAPAPQWWWGGAWGRCLGHEVSALLSSSRCPRWRACYCESGFCYKSTLSPFLPPFATWHLPSCSDTTRRPSADAAPHSSRTLRDNSAQEKSLGLWDSVLATQNRLMQQPWSMKLFSSLKVVLLLSFPKLFLLTSALSCPTKRKKKIRVTKRKNNI